MRDPYAQPFDASREIVVTFPGNPMAYAHRLSMPEARALLNSLSAAIAAVDSRED